jgi:hypothetical protein
MYRLPTDFDGKFLIGRRLEQICFNENQISLQFDADVAITIENGYAYQDIPSPVSTAANSIPAMQSNLMQLVGHTISRVEGTNDGTLWLVFENGHQLRCFDNPRYESYQIRNGALVIIV